MLTRLYSEKGKKIEGVRADILRVGMCGDVEDKPDMVTIELLAAGKEFCFGFSFEDAKELRRVLNLLAVEVPGTL